MEESPDPPDDQDDQDGQDPPDQQDPRDPEDPKNPDDSRNPNVYRSPGEPEDPRAPDYEDLSDSRDSRDPRDQNYEDLRDSRDSRDPRDPRNIRDPRDPRDSRDPRDLRDSRDSRHHNDPREDLLEICVESLVGTIFEMRLSKMETVANIKLRLQRLEGIPRHQMHLLYRGNELPDKSSLAECSVENGATLRLVLALRGGPINTRRVPLAQSHSQQQQQQNQVERQLQQMVMKNRDKIPKNGQLTVLLFRDGDQVNLYHVLERPDGSYSPLSASAASANASSEANWSNGGSTLKNLFAEEEEVDPAVAERSRENAVTMGKLSDLKGQLESLNLRKREKKQGRRPKSNRNSSGKKLERRSTLSRLDNNQHNLGSPVGKTTRQGQLTSSNKKGAATTLPPIQASKLGNPDDDACSSTTSIFPLTPQPTSTSTAAAFNRQSTLSSNNNNLSNSSSNHLPSLKMETVPEWLQKNQSNFSAQKNNIDDNIFSSDYPGRSNDRKGSIDVIDLKLRPNESSVEIVRTRRTQKLISTDVNNLRDLHKPVQGTRLRQNDLRQNNSVRQSDTRQYVHRSYASDINQGKDPSRHERVSSSSNNASVILRDQVSTANSEGSVRSIVTSSRRRLSFKIDMPDSETSEKTPYTLIDPVRPALEETCQPDIHYGRRSDIDSIIVRPTSKSRNQNISSRPTSRQRTRSGRKSSGSKHQPTFNTARPNSRRKKTPKPRCNEPSCRKRLNITNGFSCRCLKVFCAKHRHPEIHGCTFNYKEEGRRALAKAIPLVTFPKLPRI